MQLSAMLLWGVLAASPPGPPEKAAKRPAPLSPVLQDERGWREWVRNELSKPPDEQHEPHDPDPFAFSTFRGVRPEPMGEQTVINGAVMDVASLTVDLPPHVVEEEYLNRFAAAGVEPMRGVIPNTRGVRYLSYRPQGSKKLRTITLIPNGPGTVVLASVGDPSPMVEARPAVPPGFPLPPDSEAGVSISQTEGGGQNQTTSFYVRGATPEQIRNFYRDALGARGFKSEPAGEKTDRYIKGSALLTLTVDRAENPVDVSVSIVWLQ